MNNMNADKESVGVYIFYSKANTIKLPYENHPLGGEYLSSET